MSLKHFEVATFKNYILRLGAVIHSLKEEDWEFSTSWGKDIGDEKNFYYEVIKRPELTLFK